MATQFCRQCRVLVLAAIAWSWMAAAASAQAPDHPSVTPSPLAAVKARVPTGGHVYVTDTTGATMKGTLVAVTDETVQLFVGTDVRSVAATDVRRIQWQQPDSPLTGVLVGAGIGAIPGIYWLVADPNECTGLCPEEYALIAIGAVVGGLIDLAIKRKVTVYEPGAAIDRKRSLIIGPLVTRGRTGLQLAVRF
jgi:hypothetical protein